MSTFNKSIPGYSIHSWCPSDYSVDAEHSPRKYVCYQYDSINDTHYSLPYIEDMCLLQFESTVGDPSNATKLFHYKDSDIQEAKQFLGCYIRALQKDSDEFDDLAYVAFTQRYGIGNRKVGDLIFLHIFNQGHSVQDIVDSLRHGPYPEVEEGGYPNLQRSLRALEKKATKGGLI